MFYINFGKRKLVGASPEMLVKIADDTVYTYPIAGTRPRGANDAEDADLTKDLLNDPKRVCRTCNVGRFRGVMMSVKSVCRVVLELLN